MTAQSEPRRQKLRGEFCLNCGASLSTQYCPHCGQENVHGDHSVRVLIHDFLVEVAYYDSKLIRTIRTMFRHPGRLSIEWAEGKRVKYVSPIKLYLWITFVFFLVMAFRSSEIARQSPTASSTASLSGVVVGQSWIQQQVRKLDYERTHNRARFSQAFWNNLPKVLFVIMPVLALVLKLLYWRQRQYYVEHLVFVLHLHSCFFAALLLAAFLPPVTANLSPLGEAAVGVTIALLSGWMILYTFVALMRFYRQSLWMTGLKTLAMAAIYGSLAIAGVLAAVLIAINSLGPVRGAAPTPGPGAAQAGIMRAYG